MLVSALLVLPTHALLPAARLSFPVTSRPALTRLSISPRMGYESMTIEEMEAQMNEKLKALEAAESAAPAEPAPAPVAAAPEAPIAAPEPVPVAAPAGDPRVKSGTASSAVIAGKLRRHRLLRRGRSRALL